MGMMYSSILTTQQSGLYWKHPVPVINMLGGGARFIVVACEIIRLCTTQGKENSSADALSRYPVTTAPPDSVVDDSVQMAHPASSVIVNNYY